VPLKKPAKKSAKKPVKAKSAPSKRVKKIGKASGAKKVPAKKAQPAKTGSKVAVKAAAKVAVKAVKKPSAASKPILVKGKAKTALTSTTAKGATTISVYKPEAETENEVVVEEKKLLMLPPSKQMHGALKGTLKGTLKGAPSKKSPALKPIKGAPIPVATSETDEQWSAAELKAMRAELSKELIRLKKELADIENEMDQLIEGDGIGAGDDTADAGTKTFEREHEMSLVYNARDMVLQTERALERITYKSYGSCEDCENPIGKARLHVFPRATLCMSCKAKEERR
jgi:RNA polymerase-binding transcription factor DksA